MKEPINFGYLPDEFSSSENAGIVIIPVAYDGTSTWVKGADKGPGAIIEASANMELYDLETDCEVYKQGIFTEQTIGGQITTREMIDAVHDAVGYFLAEDKFTVVVGGEHSVSIGSIKAHAKRYDKLTVLQLDAHADLRDEYNGSRYNHACVMARAKELCPIVQVGIRSISSSETESADHVYITIDLDVFDPSMVPSTGTPEPGGLMWYEVLTFLKTVSDEKNVVGFDVVELCPDSNNKAPDFLAAKLIYKLLSYKFGG
jgi:agmatinase